MLECPNCGSTYKISDSRRKKEKLLGSLHCRKCSFNNLTFPIISYHTIFGDTITYQGNLELKFIKICEEKGVRILNGPEIHYY